MLIPAHLAWTPSHHDGRAGPVPLAPQVQLPAAQTQADPLKAFGQMTVDVYRLTAQAMIDLGYGSLVTGSGETDVQYVLIDVMALKREVEVVSAPGGGFVLEGHGSGLRMALSAVNVSTTLAMDYKAFAAASQLGIGRTDFSASIVGFDVSQLPYLPIVGGGSFGADQISALAESIEIMLDFMADPLNWEAFRPVRIKVALDDLHAPTFTQQAWSMHAALEQLWRRRNWSQADETIRKDPAQAAQYLPIVARLVYEAIGVNGAPNDDNVKLTGDLLWQGR